VTTPTEITCKVKTHNADDRRDLYCICDLQVRKECMDEQQMTFVIIVVHLTFLN